MIVFNQPAGLGDIFFLQKAADHFINGGNEVMWPVLPSLLYLNKYLGRSGLTFSNVEEYPFHSPNSSSLGGDVIPFCIADQLFSLPIMASKYRLINLDYSDWKNYFVFKRDTDRENSLYDKLTKGQDIYSLIGERYGTTGNARRSISHKAKFDKVFIDYIDGHNVFDWCKLIECAAETIIVETSLNYIIEKLEPKGSLFMASRHSPPNFSQIEYLFEKPWIKIYD